MTKRSHNKKRNVGIIFEQLVRTISNSLIEDDLKTAKFTKTLTKKYFKPGTELYKEHKLFQALVCTHVTDSALAIRILDEAKKGSRYQNQYLLDREKDRLIKEINQNLGKQFYNQKVQRYTDFATVQSLLNYWRSGSDSNMEKQVLYESRIHSMLLTDKTEPDLDSLKNEDVNNLVVNIMTEKFNKKYGKVLDEKQSMLIKEYVFSKSGMENNLSSTLNSIQKETLNQIQNYSYNCDNKILLEKLAPVMEQLKDTSHVEINDALISKYLLMCQLQKEFSGDNQ